MGDHDVITDISFVIKLRLDKICIKIKEFNGENAKIKERGKLHDFMF